MDNKTELMEAVLKFNLNDPDDRMSHMRCVKATDMAIVLFEITHNLQKQCEGKGEEYIFEQICDLLDEHGIIVNEIIN